MLIKCIFALVGVAFFLEFLGPVVLQKFFPQALMAPAPEVPTRPKRAGARESVVDDELSDVSNNPAHPLSTHAMLAAALSAADAAQPNSPSTDEALLLTGVDPQFDSDDYRTAERDNAATKQSEQAAQVAQVAQAQQVEVIQGIPDIFADETAQHA